MAGDWPVVDAKTSLQSDRILGAHLLGHTAEEIINIFAFAIRYGIKAEDLKRMIYAYQTSASDISHMI